MKRAAEIFCISPRKPGGIVFTPPQEATLISVRKIFR